MYRLKTFISVTVPLSFLCAYPGSAQVLTPAPSNTESGHIQNIAPDEMPDRLRDARDLYRKGDFDHAIQKYQQLLLEHPNSAEVYAGLTRVYLKRKDVKQASDTITKALQVADSPVVRVALGEVYFRQGKISTAELEWVNVIKSGRADARAPRRRCRRGRAR